MHIDKVQLKDINKNKKVYFEYRVSFRTAQEREQFNNKVLSLKMKSGKSIADVLLDLINK